MIPQYAEQVQQTRRTQQTRNRQRRTWSLQWWVRQIVYTLIVLAFVVLMALANGPVGR